MHNKQLNCHSNNDGFNWSKSYPIGDPDFWLWRTTWHKGKAYAVGYGCNRDVWVRLYSGTDGKTFHTLVDHLFDKGYPNETSIVFKGDTAFCLLRRDRGLKTGKIGTSLPPYTQWQWKDLGARIGGPDMILMPDSRLLAAVRLYSGNTHKPVRTALCWVDPHSGQFSEALTLPSGGDTSYAGLVLYQGLLWVSYYSSHEGKTSVYLAKVAFKVN